jgi:hypothetical protein
VLQFVLIRLLTTVRISKYKETSLVAVLMQVSLQKVILVELKQLNINSEIILHTLVMVKKEVMELLSNQM